MKGNGTMNPVVLRRGEVMREDDGLIKMHCNHM
jgi:hypothetical protein